MYRSWSRPMSEHRRDIDRCNTAISVGHGRDPDPDPDPDEPVNDPHDSHRWTPDEGGRWLLCAACAIRDHWPDATARCMDRPARVGLIAVPEALEALRADLEAFAAWWPDGALPSMDEWAANFFEWRIAR